MCGPFYYKEVGMRMDPVRMMLDAVAEITSRKKQEEFEMGRELAKEMLMFASMKHKQGATVSVVLLAIYLMLTAFCESVRISFKRKKNKKLN